MELLSCYATLLADAPLSSYRDDGIVGVRNYREALRALRQVVEKSGRDPIDFAVCSLRTEGMSTIRVGGEISDRIGQREGRWKSGAYKPYAVNNREDSRRVSSILGDKKRGVGRQPGECTARGSHKRQRGQR